MSPFSAEPRQLRRAAGVSVVCEAKSVRSDRDLEPQTHRAQCAPPPTCERGNAFPAKPRAILIRMDIKTRNIATPAADAPATAVPTPVVGRFAPSPSGRMHLGNVFSCLCAWLSARSQGGSIVLRIEDLDDRCKRPELAAQLIDDLTWLGSSGTKAPTTSTIARICTRTPCASCKTPASPIPVFARVPNSTPRARRTPATARPSTAAPAEVFLLMKSPAAVPCVLRPRACACPPSTTSPAT